MSKNLILHYDHNFEVRYPSDWIVRQENPDSNFTFFFSPIQIEDITNTDNVNIQVLYNPNDIKEELESVITQLKDSENFVLENPVEECIIGKNQINAARIKVRYTYKKKDLQQYSIMVDGGCGLKYLVSYTSRESKNLEVFEECFVKRALYRRTLELNWVPYKKDPMIKVWHPFNWQTEAISAQKGPLPVQYYFSPIQLSSNNQIKDNIIFRLFTSDDDLKTDIKLLQTMGEKEKIKVDGEPKACKVKGKEAVTMKIEYDFKGMHFHNVVYIVRHVGNRKWCISYTSSAKLINLPVFKEMMKRITFY
jgi:hypothetical protein